MKKSLGARHHPLVRFLSSMDLAITLLIMLAIASIIGTILQQNQPHTVYAIKFGPFWFEVFEMLGLYNVYSQIWFLSVLAFLVISICFCLWRHTPTLWREIKSYPAQQTWQNLSHFKHAKLQTTSHTIEQIQQKLHENKSYKLSSINHYQDKQGNYTQLTGKRGNGQKLGYLFTHIGVVIICLGALLDSSILLKFDQWIGNLTYETRNIPISQIDSKAFLPADNRTFRGSISIPEGKSTRFAFLPWDEGYLVQKLPFIIQLIDFKTQHYPTGQPKSFESELIIRSLNGDIITTKTIDVNHPLTVQGISIYQSSFEDGGSILDFTMFPLYPAKESTFRLSVHKQKTLTLNQQKRHFELTDFRLFNIQPLEHSTNKFRNQGPSFHYKIRRPNGTATEYENYMLPIKKDKNHFLISGIRNNPQEPFQYLYIPLDKTLSPNRFFTYLNWLQDDSKIEQVFAQSEILKKNTPPQFTLDIHKKIIKTFIQEGTTALTKHFSQIQDPDKKQQISQAFFQLLQLIFSEMYIALLQETEDYNPQTELTAQQQQFYQQTINTLSTLHQYQNPIFFRLDNFTQIQASGLQLTKAPGQFWVYLGCLLLVIGVFCMFYLPISRLWICVRGTQLLIAIDSIKNDSDHQKEIARLTQLLH
jgi:cytochrome c biogenesis protein